MTRYRLDHAVVMDTDDIPGRGGYAVVGISRGVAQAERLFVAENFGISDFLHDPQNDRTFYSFFRVPGGRHAFTRRFANGRRRNGTQNRLFVHTLFFDDSLLQGVAALPWLLLEGNVRAEGSSGEWQPLRNEVPWVAADGALPVLEVELDDNVAEDVPRRLNARLALAAKDIPNATAAVASVIGALRDQKRVLLPQGRGYEWLTLLAWSMLPRRDREELAWTQHDPLNVTGVVFYLANAVNPAGEGVALDRSAPPLATRLVQRNTASPASWRELHGTAAHYGLTIRRADTLEACLAHRDALRDVTERLGEAVPRSSSGSSEFLGDAGARRGTPRNSEEPEELLQKLKQLADTGRRLHGQPCFEGESILELVWKNVTGQDPDRWPLLLRDSGLAEVLFRDGIDRRWIDRAAAAARESPRAWFGLLLLLAGYVDAAENVEASKALVEAVRGLGPRASEMDGTFEPLVEVLEQPNVRVGPSTRALLLLARPAWKRQLVPLVTKLVGRTYTSVAGWADVVAAVAADFVSTPARAEVSELVSQFWQKVQPEEVAQMTPGSVDAVAYVNGTARRNLADTWRTRIRRLPEGEGDRLVAVLFPEAAEVRVPLAWRQIEQGFAKEATLNQLDIGLHQQQGKKYAAEMATAITKFAGDGKVARVRSLCALLRSPHVLQTVKRIIETSVLPQALQEFTARDWGELMTTVRGEELFCRGAAPLMIGLQLGAVGDENAVRQFESACRAQNRSDAAASLAAGQRNRKRGRFTRWLGSETRA
ncbi:MAG: hypothetical protein QOH21_3475 [Acidobacteriota bacterium]|jgi:hypothetical protein|nr:hypothetical protein [Acidobacteriota bacterium]